MLVAATTECFAHLSLAQALDKFCDLEFTTIELAIFEDGDHFKPSQVAEDLEAAINISRNTNRLDVVAYDVRINAEGDEYYRQFDAICRMAKANKVVTITVPSAEQGTPFNEEVEHLRRLVDLAVLQGARVSIKTQIGRLSEDADTVTVLCNNVDGLGVTLDPSHYICGQSGLRGIDKILKYVHHVHLRDSRKDGLQVRVGQGEIEYGKLIGQLAQLGYDRALAINITPMEEVDHIGELRKMRLLLESLM